MRVSTCDKCGHTKSHVIDSRDRKNGAKCRRRLCQSCGHRWSSIEIRSDRLDQLIVQDAEELIVKLSNEFIKHRLEKIKQNDITPTSKLRDGESDPVLQQKFDRVERTAKVQGRYGAFALDAREG